MRLLPAAVWAVLIFTSAWFGRVFFLFGQHAWRALHWPFQLDYGEGVVWQQATMMFTPKAYGPIDSFPAIVFHYPPVYHLSVLMTSALTGADMLYAGRGLSIACTLVSAILIALIVLETLPRSLPSAARLCCAAASASLLFCLHPIVVWALLMRVDMLCFALSLCGFWLGLKSFERPSLIYGAALCFVAAVFTKQTAVAAPTALFGLMLWRSPRLALRGIATCVSLGLVGLIGLEFVTDGGFLRHIVGYNMNRFDPRGIEYILAFLVENPLILAAAGIGVVRRISGILERRSGQGLAENPADVAWIGIIFYFVTTSMMLPTMLKSGSSYNYLIEWGAIVSMLAGTALIDALQVAIGGLSGKSGNWRVILSACAIPIFFAADAHAVGAGWAESYFSLVWTEDRGSALEDLSVRIRHAERPAISDQMVLLLRSGKPVLWEPAIFAELAATGAWDERDLVERVRAGEFSMFVTQGDRGDKLFDARYSPAVSAAMEAAYPIKQKAAGLVVHLPRSPGRETDADQALSSGFEAAAEIAPR
jgi:hypothetical protein